MALSLVVFFVVFSCHFLLFSVAKPPACSSLFCLSVFLHKKKDACKKVQRSKQFGHVQSFSPWVLDLLHSLALFETLRHGKQMETHAGFCNPGHFLELQRGQVPKRVEKQNQLNSQRSLRRRWNQAWKTRIHCWSQEKLIETHLFHTSISRILLTYYCNPGHFLDFRASAGAGAKTPGKAKSAEQPEKPKEKVESSMEDQDTLLKPGEAHRNTFVSY